MARLPRVTQTIFGSNPGFQQYTQFGSTFNNDTVYTTNIATIQSLANWAVGWYEAAIDQTSPLIEDMNSAFLVFSQQIAYLLQAGVAEYDIATTYYQSDLVANPVVSFTVTSANATAGATYTNNGQTFTVQKTITAGPQLITTSAGLPLTSGTLTKASGTGDATITFSMSVALSSIFSSISNSNTGNAITDTTNWQPIVPLPGAAFQNLHMNSTATGAEYSYSHISKQVADFSLTVPAGFNDNTGFLTIPTGITYTVAGSLCCVGIMKVPGTLIITGNVRIV